MNLHPGMDAASPTKRAWEKYKHLDSLLADPTWLRATTWEGVLCEVWRAVKAEHGGGNKSCL